MTTSGRVGDLQLAQSTAADVRASVGAPDATTRGSFSAPGQKLGDPALPDYDALGYKCSPTSSPTNIPLAVQPAVRGPYCATIYFINTATKTLAAFETTSPTYLSARATTIGLSPADAQQREGKQLIPHGCAGSFIQLGTFYQDGSATTGAAEFIFVGPTSNDPVRMIAVESNVNPVGMLFC